MKIKLLLPSKLIIKKNDNYYLDLSSLKNVLYFIDYYNKQFNTITNKYKEKNKDYLIHTGNKLNLSKDKLRDQTWFERINTIKCFTIIHIIKKYLKKLKVMNTNFNKLINLNELPRLLNYVNIVEVDLIQNTKKITRMLKETFNSNEVLKHGIIERKFYIKKIIDCGIENFEMNKPDSIILSKDSLSELNPKLKILIEIINPYSKVNNNYVDPLQMKENYLKHCAIVEDIKFKGYLNYRKHSEAYSEDIKHLYLPISFPIKTINFVQFHKIVLSELMNNIVDKNFRIFGSLPYIHKFKNIPKPNHGVLNITRQGLFTIKLLQYFKKRNKGLFNQLFNKRKLNAIILASHFISILRVGEGIRGVTESNLISIDQSTMKKLLPNFPHISIFKYCVFNNHQIYSGIFLKTILLNYEDVLDKELIDYITAGMLCYINLESNGNHKDLKIENYLFKKFNKSSEFILVSCIIWSGHYFDHCRGPWSDVFEEPFMKLLFNYINLTNKDKIELFTFLQKILIKTQIRTQPIKSSKCISNTKECCKKLTKHGRYTNKKFVEYSKNFNKLYGVLNFKKELMEL